jgi:acetyl esterase/lipase
MKSSSLLGCALAALFIAAQPACAQNLSFGDISKLPQPPADHRIAYGADSLQFGELRLPPGKGPHPVVIVVHGGCWFAEYDLNHLAAFSAALTKLGAATWSLEYRRVGDKGGAWPGTFQDVARGADYVRELAKKYPLDVRRVVVVGHSAGGQLALWLAARHRLPKESVLYTPDPLRPSGVVALAAVSDLRKFRPDCGDSVTKLLGGSPEEFGARYAETSPIELLPTGVPLRLIHGAQDKIVPVEMSREFEAVAKRKGDDGRLTVIENAGHFELIAPQSSAWAAVGGAVRSLLKAEKRVGSGAAFSQPRSGCGACCKVVRG